MCPARINFQLTNPDGSCVPRDPTNPQDNQCIQVPLPVYGVASIGGDTNLNTNLEYRIPIVGTLMFSFFDDFGIDVATNHGQLKQSPEGFASLTAPLYGCPVYNNGSCQGGISGSQVGFKQNIRPISGTNFVPRMSLGGEIAVIMPIVNAPFRLYYAYNPLRLYETALLQRRPRRRQAGQLLGRADYARHVPPGRRWRLLLRRSDGGLRRALPVPRAPQDLPLDGVNNLLSPGNQHAFHRGPLAERPTVFWADKFMTDEV